MAVLERVKAVFATAEAEAQRGVLPAPVVYELEARRDSGVRGSALLRR
jgi:hypothetical protein